jgi:hypothetical protein
MSDLPQEALDADPVGEPEATDDLASAEVDGPEGDVAEAEF